MKELIALGPIAYEPLQHELLHANNETLDARRPNSRSIQLAVNALNEIDDKRVIVLFARQIERGHMPDSFAGNSVVGFMDAYLDGIFEPHGIKFESYGEFTRWFDKNQDKIVWDSADKRFALRK